MTELKHGKKSIWESADVKREYNYRRASGDKINQKKLLALKKPKVVKWHSQNNFNEVRNPKNKTNI